MPIKIAINGFGRIGRQVFRIILENHPEMQVIAVNDLTDSRTLSHLLKYDSLYGKYNKDINYDESGIIINGKKILVFSEKDPAFLPWKDLDIDVVLECTGIFTDFQGSKKHLEAGAKKVIISAPPKDRDIPTFVLGVNEEKYNPEKDNIISNSSCTTNALAPIVKILHQNFIVQKGFMTTVHSYTNDQRILDLPHKDLRRARAAALSIIPTTTGAAKSVGEVLPELKGKLDGISLRVPTPTVSIVDFICLVEKSTTIDEVNEIFTEEAQGGLKNILGISKEDLVSVDFVGNSLSSIVDLNLTMAQDNLVKVVSWYDNEWGYSCRLAEMAEYVGKKIV